MHRSGRGCCCQGRARLPAGQATPVSVSGLDTPCALHRASSLVRGAKWLPKHGITVLRIGLFRVSTFFLKRQAEAHRVSDAVPFSARRRHVTHHALLVLLQGHDDAVCVPRWDIITCEHQQCLATCRGPASKAGTGCAECPASRCLHARQRQCTGCTPRSVPRSVPCSVPCSTLCDVRTHAFHCDVSAAGAL